MRWALPNVCSILATHTAVLPVTVGTYIEWNLLTLAFQNRKRNENPTTRSYFFVYSKVVGFKMTRTLLNTEEVCFVTSTNERGTSHNLATQASTPGWVRSNNSNSGDFPEARTNRVILKSKAITRGLYQRMPSPCYHASRSNDINKFGLSRSGGSNANDLDFQIIIIR